MIQVVVWVKVKVNKLYFLKIPVEKIYNFFCRICRPVKYITLKAIIYLIVILHTCFLLLCEIWKEIKTILVYI